MYGVSFSVPRKKILVSSVIPFSIPKKNTKCEREKESKSMFSFEFKQKKNDALKFQKQKKNIIFF